MEGYLNGSAGWSPVGNGMNVLDEVEVARFNAMEADGAALEVIVYLLVLEEARTEFA
jgi:hypothetical protein